MNPRRLLSQAALLIGALAFSTGLQAFAFTAPSTAPPNADAYAPLSTSPTAQSKQGGLLLNTGGATNGLIVQSGNVGIGTASPSQQLDVAGYVKGSGLCIGSDCRTSWPSSSSYSAGPGISISGATISNTGVVSESDPTVQSWAKTTSPSIPGNVTIGGNAQINGTVRGATYGFGGMYETADGDYSAIFCQHTNPFTGACSCPSGFSSSMAYDDYANSVHIFQCYR